MRSRANRVRHMPAGVRTNVELGCDLPIGQARLLGVLQNRHVACILVGCV
jgi:hypothetical protein